MALGKDDIGRLQNELFLAIQTNNLKDVQMVLAKIKNENEATRHSILECREAAEGKDIDKAFYNLSYEKHTPLLYALSAERLNIAQALLEAGADPFQKNNANITSVMMLAMVCRKLDQDKVNCIIKLLSQMSKRKGFEEHINEVERYKGTPLVRMLTHVVDPQFVAPLYDAWISCGAKLTQANNGEPLWSPFLDKLVGLNFLASKFPTLFSVEEFNKTSSMFGNNNAIAASMKTEKPYQALEFLKKFYTDEQWKKAINDPKFPMLHLMFQQMTGFTEEDVRVIKFLIDTGADINVKKAYLNVEQTFGERLKSRQSIPWTKDKPGFKRMVEMVAGIEKEQQEAKNQQEAKELQGKIAGLKI